MTVSANVLQIFESLIAREGGGKVTNDPNDRGGLTRWGWTQKTAQAYGFARTVDTMTHDEAIALYVQRFWIAPQLDVLATLDVELAEYVLDVGVTSGPATGIGFVQRALNVLNNQARAYPDIRQDGGLGAMTFAALRAYIAARGPDGVRVLRFMVRSQRAVFFMGIAERDPTQEIYEYGWQLQRAMLGT